MDILKNVKDLFKVKEINYDNWTFKLFYKATFGFALLSSILVGANQYIGQPVECDVNNGDLPESVFEAHCWMHGAKRIHSLPCNGDSELCKTETEKSVALQDLFKCRIKDEVKDETTEFYQWVIFVLLLTAAVFRLPHLAWKSMEGGLIRSFYSDGKVKSVDNRLKDEEDKTMLGLVDTKTDFFGKLSQPKGSMRWYYMAFQACQFLNFVVLGCVWSMTDKFLSGNFHTYGYDYYVEKVHGVGTEPLQIDYNPLCNAFPTIASCVYENVGTTGGLNKKTGTCLLPQNIMNQKIYLFLWFWFVFLMVLGGLQFLFELLIIAVPPFRSMVLTWGMGSYANTNVRQFLMYKCGVSDWFVLYQIKKNTDKHFFCLLLKNIAERLGNTYPKNESNFLERAKDRLCGSCTSLFKGSDEQEIQPIKDDFEMKSTMPR